MNLLSLVVEGKNSRSLRYTGMTTQCLPLQSASDAVCLRDSTGLRRDSGCDVRMFTPGDRYNLRPLVNVHTVVGICPALRSTDFFRTHSRI